MISAHLQGLIGRMLHMLNVYFAFLEGVFIVRALYHLGKHKVTASFPWKGREKKEEKGKREAGGGMVGMVIATLIYSC